MTRTRTFLNLLTSTPTNTNDTSDVRLVHTGYTGPNDKNRCATRNREHAPDTTLYLRVTAITCPRRDTFTCTRAPHVHSTLTTSGVSMTSDVSTLVTSGVNMTSDVSTLVTSGVSMTSGVSITSGVSMTSGVGTLVTSSVVVDVEDFNDQVSVDRTNTGDNTEGISTPPDGFRETSYTVLFDDGTNVGVCKIIVDKGVYVRRTD